jgi:2-iminobutanoate/2-iminopropanoate deaminase
MKAALSCLLAVLFALSCGAADLPALKKEKVNLGPWEDQIGYAQAVRVGNTLYVSGSVGGGGMPAAIAQAYETIQRTLAAHRLNFGHVVKENVFTTDIEALKANAEVRRKFYGADFPAATWVQVHRLYDPADVIEVEVIAVFPDAPAG